MYFCDVLQFVLIIEIFFLLTISDANKQSICTGSDCSTNTCAKLGSCTNDKEMDDIGYEAIKSLHMQIDDDHNGDVDLSESDEFLRDELKYEDGSYRSNNFHKNDAHISVSELWNLWKSSDVYNWTVDETIDWLINDVELPIYADKFRINAIDGKNIPRIASSSTYIAKIIGVKNSVHAKKLTVKAMDIVLFGSTRKHNPLKDLILVTSVVVAIGGCWVAYWQHKYSQDKVKKIMLELANIHHDDKNFKQMQLELKQAELNKKNAIDEKVKIENNLKKEIETYKTEADRLKNQRETTEEEIIRLRLAEEELVQVRGALKNAETELQLICSSRAPFSTNLQYLLQLTYENELLICNQKREAAEKRLMELKEMFDKGTKGKGMMLSLRIANSNFLENIKLNIENIKSAIEISNREINEINIRWEKIEDICKFNIRQNKGRIFLQNQLYVKHDIGAYDTKFGNSMLSLSSLDGDGMASSGRWIMPKLMQAAQQLTAIGLNRDHLNRINSEQAMNRVMSNKSLHLCLSDLKLDAPRPTTISKKSCNTDIINESQKTDNNPVKFHLESPENETQSDDYLLHSRTSSINSRSESEKEDVKNTKKKSILSKIKQKMT